MRNKQQKFAQEKLLCKPCPFGLSVSRNLNHVLYVVCIHIIFTLAYYVHAEHQLSQTNRQLASSPGSVLREPGDEANSQQATRQTGTSATSADSGPQVSEYIVPFNGWICMSRNFKESFTTLHVLVLFPDHTYHSSLAKRGLVTLVHFLGLTFCFCRNLCRANQIAEWLDIT